MNYKKIKVIGEGGNSIVYLARDEKSGKAVTLKTPKLLNGKSDWNSKRCFENEARILKELDHSGIPSLVGMDEEGLALEYVEGESMEKLLLSQGALSEKVIYKVALELSEILRYLHGKRTPIIYRDLKPSNIVMKNDGHIALIDFGAARFYSREGCSDTVNLGTYGFAAPEQFGNLGQTDPKTDIYCFGMTILQLLSGVDPKDAEKIRMVKKYGIPGVSPELMGIICKCIMPDREDRFLSVKKIQSELKAYPQKVRFRRAISLLRMSLVAAAVSFAISLGIIHFDKVKAYAAYDIDNRLPAVEQRLYNAKLWIIEHILEKEAEEE